MSALRLILALCCAGIVTLCSLWILAQLSMRWQLIAQPGGHRLHQRATPVVGGLGIFFGLLSGLIFVDPGLQRSGALLLASFFVVATGTLDDVLELPASCRFLSQSLAAIVVSGWGGALLLSLGELTQVNETLILNNWAWPLSIVAIIGLINAFNMSDGVDGQCGLLTVVTVSSLTLLVLISAQYQWLPVLLTLLASVLGFLLLNLQTPWRSRAGVFLGDAGSTLLGLILAYCLISMSQSDPTIVSPVTALWLVALPLMDTIAVMCRRLLTGHSPFRADREHFHHLLSLCGLQARQVTLCLTLCALVLATTGVVMHIRDVPEHHQFYAALGLFAFFILGCEGIRVALRRRAKRDKTRVKAVVWDQSEVPQRVDLAVEGSAAIAQESSFRNRRTLRTQRNVFG